MKLNNFYKMVVLSLFVSLAGCGGSYVAKNWTHSNTEADWDIDSAVCLTESEKLTEEDLATIARKKRSAEEYNDTVQAQVNINKSRGLDTPHDDWLSGLSGAISSFSKITAEDTHKTNKFTACMMERGWAKT